MHKHFLCEDYILLTIRNKLMMAAVVVVNKMVNDGEKLFCEMANDAATDIR